MKFKIEKIINSLLLESLKGYNGMEIDYDLDPHILDEVNAIPGIRVVSTCSGHWDRSNSFAGGNEYGEVNFRVTAQDPVSVYNKWKKLEDSETKVKAHAWGSNVQGVVWASDEGWRTHYFNMSREDIKIDEVCISVSAKFKTTRNNLMRRTQWWRNLAKRIRQVAGVRSERTNNLTERLSISIEENGVIVFSGVLTQDDDKWLYPYGDSKVVEASVSIIDANEAYLNSIFSERKGKGHAPELIDFIKQYLKKRGIEKLRCYVERFNFSSQSIVRKTGAREELKKEEGSVWIWDL